MSDDLLTRDESPYETNNVARFPWNGWAKGNACMLVEDTIQRLEIEARNMIFVF